MAALRDRGVVIGLTAETKPKAPVQDTIVIAEADPIVFPQVTTIVFSQAHEKDHAAVVAGISDGVGSSINKC